MKNRIYSKPIVAVTSLVTTANLLVGSPTGLGLGDPISGGEGG